MCWEVHWIGRFWGGGEEEQEEENVVLIGWKVDWEISWLGKLDRYVGRKVGWICRLEGIMESKWKW